MAPPGPNPVPAALQSLRDPLQTLQKSSRPQGQCGVTTLSNVLAANPHFLTVSLQDTTSEELSGPGGPAPATVADTAKVQIKVESAMILAYGPSTASGTVPCLAHLQQQRQQQQSPALIKMPRASHLRPAPKPCRAHSDLRSLGEEEAAAAHSGSMEWQQMDETSAETSFECSQGEVEASSCHQLPQRSSAQWQQQAQALGRETLEGALSVQPTCMHIAKRASRGPTSRPCTAAVAVLRPV